MSIKKANTGQPSAFYSTQVSECKMICSREFFIVHKMMMFSLHDNLLDFGAYSRTVYDFCILHESLMRR